MLAARLLPATGVIVSRRIAEVPRETVEARVDVTAAARDLAQTGILARVVEVLAADLDRARRRIEERGASS
jgi:hypothetical protein